MTKTTAVLISALGLALAAPAYADGHKEKDKMMDHSVKADHSKMEHSKIDHMKKMKMGDMDMSAKFNVFDTNGDDRIDFTEYYTYTNERGVSDVDAATEFSRVSGSQGYIDMSNFGMLNMNLGGKAMMDTSMTNKTKMNKGMMKERRMNQMSASSATTFSGQPTVTSFGNLGMNYNYGAFTDYDVNKDGRVSFSEYSTFRTKSGVTSTAAAQEFMRLSDGQRDFDEMRFSQARDMDVIGRSAFGQSDNVNTTRLEMINESERMLDEGMDGNLMDDSMRTYIDPGKSN